MTEQMTLFKLICSIYYFVVLSFEIFDFTQVQGKISGKLHSLMINFFDFK